MRESHGIAGEVELDHKNERVKRTLPSKGAQDASQEGSTIETLKTQDAVESARAMVQARFPGRRLMTAAIAASLLEACSPAMRQPPVGQERATVHEHGPKEAELERELLGALHDKEAANKALDRLLGSRSMSVDAWANERTRLMKNGGGQPIVRPDLLPIKVSTFQDVVAALPRIWTSREINGSVTFMSREDFRESYRKGAPIGAVMDEDGGKWEVACTSHFSSLDGHSVIECNADLLKEYGAEEALNETFFHEFSHSADPRRLSMPFEEKAALWLESKRLLDSGDGPESAYLSQWQASTKGVPSAEALSAIMTEAWAENMKTVFQTAHETADTTSWDTWRAAYERSLTEHYGATERGAHATYRIVKRYFDVADPDFKPWESARTIKSSLPPMKRFGQRLATEGR